MSPWQFFDNGQQLGFKHVHADFIGVYQSDLNTEFLIFLLTLFIKMGEILLRLAEKLLKLV